MTRRGTLLFAAMCVIWGIPYLLIRVAVRHLDPATLVFARTAIGALLLLPVAAARREIRPVLGRWLPLVVFAAIEIAIPWLLLARAEQHLSSSLTGLLIAAVPLIGAVVARTSGNRERLGLLNAAGLALGLAGVAALVGFDLGTAGVGPLLEVWTRCRRVRARPRRPEPLSQRPAGARRRLRLARPVGCGLRARRRLPPAVGRSVRRRDRVGRHARGRVHRGCIPRLLRPHRRDRPRARDRDHVREPCCRCGARCRRPRRVVHQRDGRRVRARARRLGARNPQAPGRRGDSATWLPRATRLLSFSFRSSRSRRCGGGRRDRRRPASRSRPRSAAAIRSS